MQDLRERMKSLLRDIWDDKDFILGVDKTIRNEYNLKRMIDYLEKNKSIELDPSDVLTTALTFRYGDSIKPYL